MGYKWVDKEKELSNAVSDVLRKLSSFQRMMRDWIESDHQMTLQDVKEIKVKMDEMAKDLRCSGYERQTEVQHFHYKPYMEYAVGDRVQSAFEPSVYLKVRVRDMKEKTCGDCYYYCKGMANCIKNCCSESQRSDHRNVYFEEPNIYN